MSARSTGAAGLVLVALAAIAVLGATPSGSSATQPPTWEKVDPPPDPAPSPRFGAAMAYDERRNQVVLFGGSTATAPSDETWIWGADHRWVLVDVPAAGRPPRRSGAAMAFDGIKDMVLFGGDPGNGAAPLGDTWIWNGDRWSEVPAEPSKPRPSARILASMAFGGTAGTALLFGGAAGISYFGDTWLWKAASSSWTEVGQATGGPSGRGDAAMTYDARHANVLLFGGYRNTNLGETWAWDGSSWSHLADSAPTVLVDRPPKALSPRRAAVMAFDAVTGRVVMFGGDAESRERPCPPGVEYCPGPSGEEDETWIWNGSSWSFQDPLLMARNGVPDERYGAAAARDPATRSVMLFGGRGGGIRLGDTWIWDGTSPDDRATTTSTAASTSTSSSAPTSTSTTSTAPPSRTPERPVVQRLVPPSGPESGGTEVRIEGRGFTGATAVAFGDVRLDCGQPNVCRADGDARLTVTSPPHARGTVDVRVTTTAVAEPSAIVRVAGGDDDQFTYFPPGPAAAADTFGPDVGGFSASQPSQPAPPGGFGSVPVPGGGFSAAPGGVAAPGAAPTPGGAPAAPAAPGAAPAAPAPAAPGFVPPAASPPPAMTAGAPPEQAEVPGIAPHYNMVRSTRPGDEPGLGGPLGVAGGAMLMVVCFGASRVHDRGRPRAQRA